MAACSVVVYHYTYRPAFLGTSQVSSFAALAVITRFGYLGVNLFFIISGFVILWSSQGRSLAEFAISRIARLFPSFWVCVLLTALVVITLGGEHVGGRTLALNLTMVPGILGVSYLDGVYWTLFVELKFYFLVSLVLVTRSMGHILWWLAGWLVVSLMASAGVLPGWGVALAMYPYGAYFISGCLLFLISRAGPRKHLLLLLALSAALATRVALQQQLDFMHVRTQVSDMVVAAAIVTMHAVFLVVAVRPSWLPASRWWYVLGSLTYPLYLLHNRIGKTIWAQLLAPLPNVLALLVALSVVFALTAAVAAVTERRLCSALARALRGGAIRARILEASAP